MKRNGKLRVYIAMSIDGFIAGAGDDLSWLPAVETAGALPPEPDPKSGALGFDAFLAQLGAVLMGRRTFDIVQGFTGDWPYADLPLQVATNRELQCDRPQVCRVGGDIHELVAGALQKANGKDVYIDGGNLIRQALDAGLVDDVVVTLAPVALGHGIPLFAGATRRHQFETIGHYSFPGGMVQWHLKPLK